MGILLQAPHRSGRSPMALLGGMILVMTFFAIESSSLDLEVRSLDVTLQMNAEKHGVRVDERQISESRVMNASIANATVPAPTPPPPPSPRPAKSQRKNKKG